MKWDLNIIKINKSYIKIVIYRNITFIYLKKNKNIKIHFNQILLLINK